ncbi:MAG: hypothetical protein H0X28_15620 [Solirubrobacterales bacterium]|nr:hypothetical protein [Solirubrobacterales bacterium]
MTAYGTFVDFMAKMPRGRAFPTGNKMAFIVERQSGLVVGTHLDGEAILTSKMARRHATAVMASHRPRAKAASWGKGCSQTHHCYATAEWLMHGGEMVEGTLDIEDTTSMNVPGWASGDFVDHEGWTIFEPAGYWVEAGNTAGEYFDCCGRHPFYAHKNAGGYGQYVAPGTVTGEPYYQMNSTGGNAWSTYWWGNLVNTEWGFSTYSNDLEVGLEVAANTKPATSASIADNATWTDGSVHNWNKAEWYHDSGTCIGPNAKAPAVGNVSVSTC